MNDASKPAKSPEKRLVLHTRVVTGSGGGPDKTILNSPRFLTDQGYPMICAYLRDPNDEYFSVLEQRAAQWNAPLIAVDDFGALDWGVIARFRRICEDEKPAIWHGHDYKTNLLGLVLRRKVPMRLVTTVHGWVKHTWKTPLYYAIDRFCLRHYDQVICVSQDIYDTCRDIGIAYEKCWHVPNAIDTNEFRRRRDRDDVKREFGVSDQRMVIGAVGRLSAEKGFDLLIRAVRVLVDDGLDIELWIAGEGDQDAALTALVDELGLVGRVRLLGFHSDPLTLYHAMDVFVVSSLREGLPNVLLEAMALEVPVVSTKIAGVPKLVNDNKSGLLIEPGSVRGLHEALARVLGSRSLRDNLARSARKTIEEKHSFRKRMDKIKTIYDVMFTEAVEA